MSSWDNFFKTSENKSGSDSTNPYPAGTRDGVERNPVLDRPRIVRHDSLEFEDKQLHERWDQAPEWMKNEEYEYGRNHPSNSQPSLVRQRGGAASGGGGLSNGSGSTVYPRQVGISYQGSHSDSRMDSSNHPMGVVAEDPVATQDAKKIKEAVTLKINRYKEKLEKSKQTQLKLKEDNKKLRAIVDEYSKSKLEASRGKLLQQTMLGSHLDGKSNREEKEKRAQLRRELLEGIDELANGDDDDEMDLKNEENPTCWNQFTRQITAFVTRHLPFSSEVSFIQGRYGSGIGAYFRFYRFLVANSYVFVVIWGYAFARQWMKYDGSYSSSQGALPYWTYFSAWAGGDFFYVFALLLSIIFLCLVSFVKWISDDKDVVMEKVFEVDRQPQKFAAIGLTSWDFALQAEREIQDHKHAIFHYFEALFAEEDIRRRVMSRTKNELLLLYIRRGIGMTINLAFVVACWVAIVVVTLNQQHISYYFTKNGSQLSFFANYAAPMTTALINAILPEITFLITEFEKWDDEATLLKHQMWRLYFGRQFNLLINLLTYYSIAKESSPISAIPSSFNTDVFKCGEDAAGNGLFNLMLIEFLIQKVVYMGIYYSKECFHACCAFEGKHEEFRVSEGMINLLYFQSLIWISIPMYPFGSLISAFLMYMNFKFEMKILTKYRSKPSTSWNARDTSTFFSKFYNMTLVLAFASYYYFFISSWDCKTTTDTFLGPFATTDNHRPWSAVRDKVGDLGLDWLYSIITNPIIYIFMAVLSLLNYYFRNNVIFSLEKLISRNKELHHKENEEENSNNDEENESEGQKAEENNNNKGGNSKGNNLSSSSKNNSQNSGASVASPSASPPESPKTRDSADDIEAEIGITPLDFQLDKRVHKHDPTVPALWSEIEKYVQYEKKIVDRNWRNKVREIEHEKEEILNNLRTVEQQVDDYKEKWKQERDNNAKLWARVDQINKHLDRMAKTYP